MIWLIVAVVFVVLAGMALAALTFAAIVCLIHDAILAVARRLRRTPDPSPQFDRLYTELERLEWGLSQPASRVSPRGNGPTGATGPGTGRPTPRGSR